MKKVIVFGIFLLLLYTCFVGLDWGLPYPMHPDERNMAVSIQRLNCEIQNPNFKIQNCFNPHFFAYGQFPLYLGYILIQIYHFVAQKLFLPISFFEAVMSLRIISAIASVATVFVLMKIIRLLFKEVSFLSFIFYFLFFIFQPYFIQFAHFGTTESLLMLLYTLIIYYSLQLFNKLEWIATVFLSLFSGLAIATKMSSFIFSIIPSLAVLFSKSTRKNFFLFISPFLLLTAFFSLFFSPHNLISLNDFLGSMNYESAVAIGKTKVFYTRQFENVTPILFQMNKVFPYSLGWIQYLFALLGFIFLPWRDRKISLLRCAFLIYFISVSFLYVKWTRFMAPALPLLSVFAVLFLYSCFEHVKRYFRESRIHLYIIYCIFYAFFFTFLIPGIAYLAIYQNPDVRFIASDWIHKNIPEGSYILSETANVIDIPFQNKKSKIKNQKVNYNYISFNFYDLDENVQLQLALKEHLARVDYIFVPSRRIFKNHPKTQYPALAEYYEKLFDGDLGFQKVAEFTSYPRIEFFGKKIIEFPDENAEETWSVFDHPVVRIYKRV